MTDDGNSQNNVVLRGLEDSLGELSLQVSRLSELVVQLQEKRSIDYAFMDQGIGVTKTHRGHRMYVSTRDLALTPSLIFDGKWEANVEEEVLRHIKPGGMAIEVGANMGYHTLAMAQKLGSKGNLVSVEANPEIFKLLSWTVKANGFHDRVKLLNVAASDHLGEVLFRFVRTEVGGGHIIDQLYPDDAEYITVPCVRLDDAIEEGRPVDVLRMDAEGAEALILKGAQKVISRSPDLVIITEWAPSFIRSRKSDPAEMLAFLRGHGFAASSLDGSSFHPIEMEELMMNRHREVVFARTR